LEEFIHAGLAFGIVRGEIHHYADPSDSLLRAGGCRSERRAAEQRDERAAVHSITSSARTSKVGGTSKPSALAVLRLRVVSYFVGASTGRLAGLAPRKMRST